MSKRNPTYLDLFAGAGGLSEGFYNNGYIDIAHVEMNIAACETLKTRSVFHYLKNNGNLAKYYKYLRHEISKEELYEEIPDMVFKSIINHTISQDSMEELYSKIDAVRKDKKIRKIDVVIGGPPCQAYSLVGRARKADGMKNDSRNFLYNQYCEILKHYKPKMFVFENVMGLYSANDGEYYKDLKRQIGEIGYEVHDELLEFSNYGVLQNRKRIILIGWLRGSNKFYPTFKKLDHSFVVDDILNDLPVLHPGDSCSVYKTKVINEYLKRFNIRDENDVLTLNAARKLNEHDAMIYKMVINEWNANKTRFKYTNLDINLRTHNNTTSFLDRFKIVASELPASQTIVAHLSKDGHYFIHPDIEQCRSITVREAARLQSFPDNYFFEGNRGEQFIQVGNAVPPIISNMIAEELLKQLK